MKLKKFKFKQILKLHLLNSKAYEYASKKVSSGIDYNLTQVISDFKKALHVIFQYNKANKKILFIGVPKKLELKINKLTAHIAVSSSFDLQGVISNDLKSLKFSKIGKHSSSKTYLKSLMPKLVKKPELIVLFSHEKKQNIITESYAAKVPLILFGSENESKETQAGNLYNLQEIGNGSTSTPNNNLFFFGLNFLFKTLKKGFKN